jgi:signal transduction histidine kinase
MINLLKFTQTIKFKLASVFTLLLLASTLITLISINSSLRAFRDPPHFDDTQTVDAPQGYFDQATVIAKIEEERASLRDRVALTSFLIILLQILLVSIGTYIAVYRMLAPLQKLNKTMKEINDLALKSKIISHDEEGEIGELIDNFNRMIERLNVVFEKQKEFVENVSHEIKTPLTIIKTNLESVVLLNPDQKPEVLNSIERTIKSIDSLNKLVEDLLLLSTISKKELPVVEINLNHLINKIIGDLKSLMDSKNIILHKTFSKEDIQVKAHKNLLGRALYNLIENSIKYSNSEQNIFIELIDEDKDIIIKIKDEGIGIPLDKIERIFERFYRVDQSRSRTSGGMGLGLAITKEILENNGADVSVKSEEGKGSEFIIRIKKSI